MDFYYKDFIIGRIRNLKDYECERAMDMWESLGEDYWWTINEYIDLE